MFLISFDIVNEAILNSSNYFQKYLLPYDVYGLLLLSFFNSSISPIPTEILLVPLCLMNPELALFYGVIASIASVAGALFAWYLGYYGGRGLLKKLAFNRHKEIEEHVEKHGMFVVGLSGISPLPFKLFCIASGVYEMDKKRLLLVSSVFRGFRFIGLALAIGWFGEMAVSLLADNLTQILILLSVLVSAVYFTDIEFCEYKSISNLRR